jgi:tetratricopeptide (TPR) repeat protein
MRSRRLRRTADALTDFGAHLPSDQIRVVAWRLEGGGHVDAGPLAEAARLALINGDDAMAERILGRAGSVDRTPEIVQLLAELKFRRGETDAVEELLESIDNDELDDPARAQVLRRRATNLFFGRGQFREGVDLLNRALGELVEPTSRQGLEAYHVLLLTTAGFVSEAIACSEEPLRELGGAPRLELLRGRALALAASGRATEALALVAEGRGLHGSLPADLDRPGLSFLLFTEVVALGELGQLDDAAEAVRQWRAKRPERTSGNWIALAEARVHLVAGRPDAVTTGLAPLVRETHALGHGATERWALAMVASARLLEGDVRGAADDLARVAMLEHGERGLFHSDIDRAHAWLAVERDGLAVGCDKLNAAAADAARTGRHAFEAALLHDIARFGSPGAVASRLGQLAETTQGALVRARAAHAAGAATSDESLLDGAATTFEQCGTPLLAAEAATELADCLADHGDERGATTARARVARLRAALPIGITTPILAGLSTR